MHYHLVQNCFRFAAAMLALWYGDALRRCTAQSPQVVSVAQPIRNTTADIEFDAQLEPVSQVIVRSSISGVVDEVAVVEGQIVERGQLLVRIDDAPLRADVESQTAEVERLQTRLDELQKNVDAVLEKRRSQLADIQNDDADRITAARDLVAANLKLKQIDLDQLKQDLEAARIVAPLAGQVRQLTVSVGDRVDGVFGGATKICTIVGTDQVRACFDCDVEAVAKLRRILQRQGVSSTDGKPLAKSVRLSVADEAEFSHDGSLDYVGSHIDPATGRIRGCAVFPNIDGTLTDLAVAEKLVDRQVRVKVSLDLPQTELLVSELAIGRDRSGRDVVYVVDPENRVVCRPVRLGGQRAGLHVVNQGVQAGDWLVVSSPATRLNPIEADLAPIAADVRFGSLREGEIVRPMHVPMPRTD